MQQETATEVDLNAQLHRNSTEGPILVVRTEEALIVIFVLVLWMVAIALFFHRWGKIRMLEPYQPKFIQEHRSSCPLVDAMPLAQRSSITRMSMGLAVPMTSLYPGHPGYMRPRQNSVFVGAQVMSPPQPPRKTRSAMDIHSMILSEGDAV